MKVNIVLILVNALETVPNPLESRLDELEFRRKIEIANDPGLTFAKILT